MDEHEKMITKYTAKEVAAFYKTYVESDDPLDNVIEIEFPEEFRKDLEIHVQRLYDAFEAAGITICNFSDTISEPSAWFTCFLGKKDFHAVVLSNYFDKEEEKRAEFMVAGTDVNGKYFCCFGEPEKIVHKAINSLRLYPYDEPIEDEKDKISKD